MGQEQPVQVFVLITEDTIEEKLLSTLSAKHNLALAALEPRATWIKSISRRHRKNSAGVSKFCSAPARQAPSDMSLRRRVNSP